MKKIALLFACTAAIFTSFAASTSSTKAKKDPAALIASIEGKWQEQNGQIVVQRTIKLNKTTFDKAQQYLSSRYKTEANGALKTEDRTNGLLIGEGYKSFRITEVATQLDKRQTIPHTLRTEIKNGKLHITATADTVEWSTKSRRGAKSVTAPREGNFALVNCEPSRNADKRCRRNDYLFYYAVNSLISTIDNYTENL